MPGRLPTMNWMMSFWASRQSEEKLHIWSTLSHSTSFAPGIRAANARPSAIWATRSPTACPTIVGARTFASMGMRLKVAMLRNIASTDPELLDWRSNLSHHRRTWESFATEGANSSNQTDSGRPKSSPVIKSSRELFRSGERIGSIGEPFQHLPRHAQRGGVHYEHPLRPFWMFSRKGDRNGAALTVSNKIGGLNPFRVHNREHVGYVLFESSARSLDPKSDSTLVNHSDLVVLTCPAEHALPFREIPHKLNVADKRRREDDEVTAFAPARIGNRNIVRSRVADLRRPTMGSCPPHDPNRGR